jgi:hypothetical protein
MSQVIVSALLRGQLHPRFHSATCYLGRKTALLHPPRLLVFGAQVRRGPRSTSTSPYHMSGNIDSKPTLMLCEQGVTRTLSALIVVPDVVAMTLLTNMRRVSSEATAERDARHLAR